MSVVAEAPSEGFYVSGGTIPPDSPSYVERAADRELFEALLQGEFAYVLNSRQMGKSSLAVRTIQKLQLEGVTTGFVDLTRLGSTSVTPEQWYSGLLLEIGRSLGLRTEAAAYVRDQREVGPTARLLGFLQDVALARNTTPVVLLIDEIDVTKSLTFSTGEFFAGIRQLYNGRASNPELKRLTLCLMGAALPGDLIEDARTTPFNVGRRIELRDFTVEEAKPLAAGLGPEGEVRLGEIMAWTNGHPYLTQALCSAYVKRPQRIKDLVQERYLGKRAIDTDSNLADVGNRLLGSGDPTVTEQLRSDTLSLFDKLLRSDIQDDEANPSAARIKMSGVARLHDGVLTMRNLIYGNVFNRAWVRENMPAQESRRQRQAFWKGVARSSFGMAVIILALVGFAAMVKLNLNEMQAPGHLYQMEVEVRQREELDQAVKELAIQSRELSLAKKKIAALQSQLRESLPKGPGPSKP